MRIGISLAVLLLVAAPCWCQNKPEPPSHFGIVAETEFYPQDSPKQAMASIAKALERKRIDYLLAHLVDPGYTDPTFVKYYRQKFGKAPDEERDIAKDVAADRVRAALSAFVAEVNDHLTSEPKQTIRLTRLLKEGNVEETGTTAKVTLKDTPNVTLTLKQVDGRWMMDNAIEGEKKK